MLDLFKQHLSEKFILTADTKVICAVSGGVDSMVLCDLLRRSGFKLVIAHVNHKTRGEENDAEEDLVRSYADRHQIQFEAVDLPGDKLEKGNFHANARSFRYSFFEELRRKYNATCIATAHHVDDNVETFFIHLLRTSGLRGLSGIPVKNGYVIRPLLAFSKNELVAYAEESLVPYLEDSSNRSDKYLRNAIRHQITNPLAQIKPGADDAVNKSIQHLNADYQLLHHLVQQFVESDKDGLIIRLESCPAELRQACLYHIAAPFHFNYTQVEDIIRSNNNGAFTCSDSHLLRKERRYYIIAPLEKEQMDREIMIEDYGIYRFNNQMIKVSAGIDSEKDYWFEQLPFPFKIRKRQPGDRFRPKGMKGRSKKVKDHLIDRKFSTKEKEDICILERAGEIVGLLGLHKSEGYDGDSNKAIGLRIERMD